MFQKSSARTVAAANEPGKYADGDGLYLVVSKDNDGSVGVGFFYFTWEGKHREMGPSSAREVTLAQVRQLADAARSLVRTGIDPIAEKAKVALAIPTFGEFADIKIGFRNEKHWYQ